MEKFWLQNDYIKFIGFAHEAVECTGVGIWGFVTDNSYLDGPTFRGVRFGLMEIFKNLWILDLHGSSRRRDRTASDSADENIFDIQRGVSIALGVANQKSNEGVVSYSNITGSRIEKYSQLLRGNFNFKMICPATPFYIFVASERPLQEEYDNLIKITDIFVAKGNGFMTGRDDFIIGFTHEEIEARMKNFFNLSIHDTEIRHRYGIHDYRAFKIAEVRRRLKFQPSRIVKTSYRPFDHRWTYFQRPIIQEWQSSVHTHMFGRNNRALCVGRAGNVVGGTWDICFCTKLVTDLNQFYRGGNVSLPIYQFPKEGNLINVAVPNLTHGFVALLGRVLNLPLGKSGFPKGLILEDVFHYTYAIFYSPGYRSRYAEFLKIDFPRLPLPGSLALFRGLARLGGKLVALHLLKSPTLDTPRTSFIGNNRRVGKVGWTPDEGGTVWIDGKGSKAKFKPGTSGFHPVPEDVWNFHVGGYQVCEKWLKDRGPKKGKPGRILTDEDVAHYHKIVIALTETIRLMAEIDHVIDAHGGWPGAFVTSENARN